MQLHFDSSCPVCRSFAKLLRKNLDGQIELLELSEQAKDFKLVSSGKTYYGKEAIDVLVKEIPKVKDFFWMLPDSYRGKAVHKTYALGRFFRRLSYFFSRKCQECG